jgi:hypothetical protein
MTTSADLLGAVKAALTRAPDTTPAGANVFTPGDWPAWDNSYPVLKLRVQSETKQMLGLSGPPAFSVTTTIGILGEVTAFASASDGGATEAEDELWALARAAEIAVIGEPALGAMIQQWTGVRSTLVFSSEGEKHLAGIKIEMDLLFIQGPDDFFQAVFDDLDEIAAEDSVHPPLGFDAVNLQE